MSPPLAIVQARIGSKRLPRKMLLDVGGKPLVAWALSAAQVAFGVEHTVAAIPASAENDELADVLESFKCPVFRWNGPEHDVLGRFHACAHTYRWHPFSVIVRVTPDDPYKSARQMQRVAAGERLPVEFGGEAFTLEQLDMAHIASTEREHLTHALFDMPPPPAMPGIWTVDTQEQLDDVRDAFAKAQDTIYGDMHITDLAGALA